MRQPTQGRNEVAEEKFETNLLRLIASQLYFSIAMQAAREMHGKSYFSLGVAEKASIDQMVNQQVAANLQVLTPDFVMFQTVQKPVGFLNPATGKAEPSKPAA